MEAGGTDNGPPGPRPLYHPNYYGAFVLDPDGHNIEAVCHAPRVRAMTRRLVRSRRRRWVAGVGRGDAAGAGAPAEAAAGKRRRNGGGWALATGGRGSCAVSGSCAIGRSRGCRRQPEPERTPGLPQFVRR